MLKHPAEDGGDSSANSSSPSLPLLPAVMTFASQLTVVLNSEDDNLATWAV